MIGIRSYFRARTDEQVSSPVLAQTQKTSLISNDNPIRDLFVVEQATTHSEATQAEKLISQCIANAKKYPWSSTDSVQTRVDKLHRLIADTLQAAGIMLHAEKTDLLLVGLKSGTIDCDTYAFLFSAAAYELQWPVTVALNSDATHALIGYQDKDTMLYFDPLTGSQETDARRFGELIKLDTPEKRSAQYWANAGNWLYTQTKYAKARVCYETALEIDKNNVNAQLNLNKMDSAKNIAGLTMVSPTLLSVPTGMAALPIVGSTILQWQSSYYQMNQAVTDSFGTPTNPAGYTGGANGAANSTGVLDSFGGRLYVDDQVTDFNGMLDSADNELASPWVLQRGAVGPHYRGGTLQQYFAKNSAGADTLRTLAYDSAGVYTTETIPEFVTRTFSIGSGTVDLLANAGGLQIDCQNLTVTPPNNSGGFTTTRRYYLGYVNVSGDFVVQQVFATLVALQTATLTANVMDNTRSWALCYVDQVNVAGKNYYIKSKENIDMTPAIQQLKANILKKVNLAGQGTIAPPTYNTVTKQFEATYTRINTIPAPSVGVTYEYALVWNGGSQILAGFNPNLATSTITLPVNPFTVTGLKLVCRTLVANVGATGFINSDGTTAATSTLVDLVGSGIELNASSSQTRTLTGTFLVTGQTAGVFQYAVNTIAVTGLIAGMTRVWRANWTGAGAPVTITDPTLGGFTIPGNPDPAVVTNLQIYYEDYAQYDVAGNPTGTPEVSTALALSTSTAASANTRFRGTLKVAVLATDFSKYSYALTVNTDDINAYTPIGADVTTRVFYVECNGISVANYTHIPTTAELNTVLATANPFADKINVYYIDTYLDLSTKQSEKIVLVKQATKLETVYAPSMSPLNTGNSQTTVAYAAVTDTTMKLPVKAMRFVTTRPICPYVLDSTGKPITGFTKTQLSDGRYEWTVQFTTDVHIAAIRTQDCGPTEGTVTFVGGETQPLEIFNTENLELDSEKRVIWGESQIQRKTTEEMTFELSKLSANEAYAGGIIYDTFGVAPKFTGALPIAVTYANRTTRKTIQLGFYDSRAIVLKKIQDVGVISQEDINKLAPAVDLQQFFNKQDNRYTFKPGLTEAQITADYKDFIASKFFSDPAHVQALGLIWAKIAAIFADHSTLSITYDQIDSLAEPGPLLDAIKKYFQDNFTNFSRDAKLYSFEARPNPSEGLLPYLRNKFLAIGQRDRDLSAQESLVLNSLLALYREKPPVEDAQQLLLVKEHPLSYVQPSIMAGTGIMGNYLGLNVLGKAAGLIDGQAAQLGINYNLKAARYLDTAAPDTLFFKGRAEPYLLLASTGIVFDVSSLIEVYNEQLRYQDTLSWEYRGGLDLHANFFDWGGLGARYLLDSFSAHHYLIGDVDVGHTFTLEDTTHPKATPFFSALGFKLAWKPEMVIATQPLIATSFDPTKFTVGINIDFLKAVRLDAEWQQSFGWPVEGGTDTALAFGLSGLDQRLPWAIKSTIQFLPNNVTQIAADAAIMPWGVLAIDFGVKFKMNAQQTAFTDVLSVALNIPFSNEAKKE